MRSASKTAEKTLQSILEDDRMQEKRLLFVKEGQHRGEGSPTRKGRRERAARVEKREERQGRAGTSVLSGDVRAERTTALWRVGGRVFDAVEWRVESGQWIELMS
ncbi:hypothetical protein AAHE18_14G157000 [Arachis hypogaea]